MVDGERGVTMMSIYKDAKRSVHERVADLLARMTPEEKFAQMHAYWLVLSERATTGTQRHE